MRCESCDREINKDNPESECFCGQKTCHQCDSICNKCEKQLCDECEYISKDEEIVCSDCYYEELNNKRSDK